MSKTPTPLIRVVFWLAILVVGIVTYLPGIAMALRAPTRVGDFFQEWASARNYFEGLPIYTPQEITAWRYLRYRPSDHANVFVLINGHPPTSVLLSLPFAQLDYARAFLIWNWLSLAAMVGATAISVRLERDRLPTWFWIPLLTMLFSNSLQQHLIMGQLGTLLVLLIVGAAAADDRNRQGMAGALVGTAAALKLFPVLLFVYFVINRRWRTVVVGLVTMLSWVGFTWLLFGTRTFTDYLRFAVPEVLRYRDWWTNYSITGAWFKLFDCSSNQTSPMWKNPQLASVGTAVSTAAILLFTSYLVFVGRKRRESRRTSLALLMVVLVLASPIAWDHYFVLLLWPMLRAAASLGDRKPAQFVYCYLSAVLWLNPLVLRTAVALPRVPVSLWGTLTLISLPFYALLALYALLARQVLLESAVRSERKAEDDSMTPAETLREFQLVGAR